MNVPRGFVLLASLALLSTLALAMVARGDTIQGENVRISFNGQIRPVSLPRARPAPVSLHVAGSVEPTAGARPAGLERVTIRVNRNAHFTTRGLPRCSPKRLEARTSAEALRVCGKALLGRGEFESHIDIPDQAPFPSHGQVLAFNATRSGNAPAVALHIYGRRPAPTTNVLSTSITRSAAGDANFGPELAIVMPEIGDDWGYVTGFDLTLHRRYRYQGRRLSLVTATCPAPAGLDVVPFRAARGTFELADGQLLTHTVSGNCRATNRP